MRRWGVTDKRLEFSDFYAAARDDCLQIVLVTVGDRQLAEDLVAEAFTRAWASWRAVREHPAPRAWVVRTALNLSVSWWRRRRREIALGDSDLAAPGGDAAGPGDELLAAVRRLPVRQQQVIILRVFFDGVLATVQFDVYLRRDHGRIYIPSVTPCYYPLPNPFRDMTLMSRIFPQSSGRSGQILFVINPSAIPAGTELWIGAIRPLRYGFLGRAEATLIYPSGRCPSAKPTRFAYSTELPIPTGKTIIIHEK